MVRRWYAAVPVLAIVLLIGTRLVDAAEPEYRATGSVVLLPYDPTAVEPAAEADIPADEEEASAETTATEEDAPPRNPYADFNGSVNITAEVLAGVGSGDALRERVVEDGGTSDFVVAKQEDLPILDIEATADRPADAIATVSVVADALDAELAARQERFEVLLEDRMVMEVVLLPEGASQLETARNRALTVVIAVGLAGVIAATVAAESLAQGRRRSRQAKAERAASDRAARFSQIPGASRDGSPITGQLLPPDPRTFTASNGAPTTPSKERRR